jgi:chromosome segregation ATPase
MTGEIKTKISQLLEMNRALAHDLDVSHRCVAELSCERDVLRERVIRLESEIGQLEHRGAREGSLRESRADLAEERLREMILRFRDVEEERDDIRLQLDEMTLAMDEIRSRLTNLPATGLFEVGALEGAACSGETV